MALDACQRLQSAQGLVAPVSILKRWCGKRRLVRMPNFETALPKRVSGLKIRLDLIRISVIESLSLVFVLAL